MNAAVVPLSVSGGISIALGVSGGDVILDTSGYYAATPSVTSLNTLTGDLTLLAGTNVTITPGTGTLSIAAIAGGISSLNALTGGVTLTGGGGVTMTPSGNTLTITAPAGWDLAGNSGTTPGTNFIGTTDSQALHRRRRSREQRHRCGRDGLGGRRELGSRRYVGHRWR